MDLTFYSKSACNRRLNITPNPFYAHKGALNTWNNNVLGTRTAGCPVETSKPKLLKHCSGDYFAFLDSWLLNIRLEAAAVFGFYVANYSGCAL